MALALLANTSKRIVAILGANPGVWSGSVSTNVGAFPDDNEILAATLEADEWVATQGYFQSVNETLSDAFDTLSSNLVNGDNVPFHHGRISKVEVSQNGSTWTAAVVEAQHEDDILNANANETYVQGGAFDFLWKIARGRFWTTAPFGRITYPEYTRTSVLQCNKNEESLIVFRAVAILAKNASPALFDYYDQKANAGLQQLIQDGAFGGEDNE